MRYLISILAVSILTVSVALAQSKPAAVTTVPKVDLNRYAGQWYEIAKYPNKFQKDCVGNISATYTLKSDSKIEVLNKCLTKEGIIKDATGEAKVADKASNAKLKVRFAPGFISFLPFVWANYWIIDLDAAYNYAVIGTPDRKYFWILSRSQEMNDSTYQAILRRAESQGFEPAKVVKTQHGLTSGKGSVLN